MRGLWWLLSGMAIRDLQEVDAAELVGDVEDTLALAVGQLPLHRLLRGTQWCSVGEGASATGGGDPMQRSMLGGMRRANPSRRPLDVLLRERRAFLVRA